MTGTAVRGGVRETDVWEAADALLLEGARPTIERIRQKVGRGSPNTVGPYLDTWFKGLGARIRDPGAFAAAPAVPDPIAQAAAHFWETALAVARNEAARTLAEERDQIQAAAAQVEAQRTAFALERAELTARMAVQEDALQFLRAQLAELRDQRDILQRTLDERNAAYAAAEIRLAALAGDLDTVRQRVDKERARFEDERRALDERAAAHEKRWLQEVDRAREAVKVTEARAATAATELGQRLEVLQGELRATAAERGKASQRVAAQEVELARLRSDHAAAVAMTDDLRARLARREAELATQAERLQEQLALALHQLGEKEREHGAIVRTLSANAQARSAKAKSVRRVR